MSMRLVERMTQAPPQCLYCGRGNTPDEDGKIGPFLDTGIEVNWGDPVYICEGCAGLIAGHFGWIAPDTAKDLRRSIRRLEKQLHDKNAELEMKARRARAKEKVTT